LSSPEKKNEKQKTGNGKRKTGNRSGPFFISGLPFSVSCFQFPPCFGSGSSGLGVKSSMNDVAGRVARVRDRITAAAAGSGRDAAEITLVAVAKQKSAALVDAALEAGVTDIGENYVQEAEVKRAAVRGAARWHFIGHLQRNKAARALELFDVIQTVDSTALGRALARHAAARGRRLPVLIEVKLSAELSKSGIAPEALAGLLEELRQLPSLSVEGLMTVPPAGPVAATRPYFRQLRALRDQLGLRELSMGMSDDFEAAIEEGATMVRVGRAIFGER
jgi:pyridoxal phosphate enzyme (YggS family)